MAKNITLMGADYPDVPAVQLPQTGGGTATFYDIDEFFETIAWTPDIPRITYTELSDNYAIRAGNIVVCSCKLKVTASENGNTYISYSCFPMFGKTTRRQGSGHWWDVATERMGTMYGAENKNVWFEKGEVPASLSTVTGDYIRINYIYTII